jgi:hypothetical protein
MTTSNDAFDQIKQRHANIKRKIARCQETKDVKRLVGLWAELEKVRQNIDAIKPSDYVTKPEFRRSYAFESFMEGLLTGRRKPVTGIAQQSVQLEKQASST